MCRQAGDCESVRVLSVIVVVSWAMAYGEKRLLQLPFNWFLIHIKPLMASFSAFSLPLISCAIIVLENFFSLFFIYLLPFLLIFFFF